MRRDHRLVEREAKAGESEFERERGERNEFAMEKTEKRSGYWMEFFNFLEGILDISHASFNSL